MMHIYTTYPGDYQFREQIVNDADKADNKICCNLNISCIQQYKVSYGYLRHCHRGGGY